jgi:prepilin-type N-terminal cleavage/methylation domain-containing protein/prepilin-type processing-associated H-X9-DG protein
MRTPEPRSRTGFSLVELLLVAAIVSLLAALLLAALGKGRARVVQLQCLNNQRQLTLVWLLYAEDHAQQMVPNGYDDHPQTDSGQPRLWVAGGSHLNPMALVDSRYLLDPRFAAFADYVQTLALYKCPADRRTRRIFRTDVPQTRSYSLNGYLGPTSDFAQFNSEGYIQFRQLGDLALKSPAKTLAFSEVNPYSICFPAFLVEMPEVGQPHRPNADGFFHFPSALHQGAGVTSFADGHAEIRRWHDGRTTAPVVQNIPEERGGPAISHAVNSPRNPDLNWLRKHSTVPE